MLEVGKLVEMGLEICPVFTRWQVRCKKCGSIFYVDTEPESIGEEILEMGNINCSSHPGESSVVELV
ncbi:unnamed protein product [marine sediment metagenome]|uniref:Uncharacterized protein n=1 Tax=marine sediment metagenome TaxID=412755 RepID=X1KU10_9ZZZZ